MNFIRVNLTRLLTESQVQSLKAFDEICNGYLGMVNTYPMGTPTNKLYPELFTICEEPHTFEKILAYIYKWLNDTDKPFRRFTRHGVTFDIRLTTDRGAVKIPVF